jgi:predicted MPP superfamily phosphohydrolase
MTEARLARIAQQAAALQADLVVITGDLIDVSEREAKAFTRAMRDLHGKLGTYAILGNHDYLASAAAVERAVRDAGMTFLRNGGARVERGSGSLWIGGVDDPSRDSPHGPRPVLALRGAAPEEKRVVLAHRPQLFDECARAGADLVLSGHTHGGQVALSPLWSFARLLGPYTMGHYRKGASQLYVHRGMGTVGPAPLRLGSPPEIALLTLRAS